MGKIRMIVLEGLTAEDVMTLRAGGFFGESEIVIPSKLPSGVTGQVATLRTPESASPLAAPVDLQAVTDAPFNPEPFKPQPPLESITSIESVTVVDAPVVGFSASTAPNRDAAPMLTNAEYEAVLWYECAPPDVIRAAADGQISNRRLRSEHTEEQLSSVVKAYAAVKSGVRPDSAARRFLDPIFGKTAAAPAAAASTSTTKVAMERVSPPPPDADPDAELVKVLNSRKYMRQICSDLIDRGFNTRALVQTECERLASKVPYVASLGRDLPARIDASFGAIGM